MNRLIPLSLFTICGLCTIWANERPNVVLIICDDLNDYSTGICCEDGHRQSLTPNVRRLAESGAAFRRAYSNNPVCAPSRSSFLTGIYPQTSGNLFWDKWFHNPVLANSKTIMEHFRDNGYHVTGTGKVMHDFKREIWSEFGHETDYGPFAWDGEEFVAHPSVPQPFNSIGPVDGSFAPLDAVPFQGKGGWGYGKNWQYSPMRYVTDSDRDPTPDERNADWAAARLRSFAECGIEKPFFLAVGFIRPHTPLHVPQAYFDKFPLESLEPPVIKANDSADTHYKDLYNDDVKGLKYFRLLSESYADEHEGLLRFTQAYLASVAAVDECIGKVLDAIEANGLSENTIVVLTSDHGWNMGEKDFLFKNSLWEESTRVPFIIRAPGVTTAQSVIEQPISLIDLYPTLNDLCQLSGSTLKNDKGSSLDGFSVRPLLEDPAANKWDGPAGAITMLHAHEGSKAPFAQEDYYKPNKQHWSIRTQDWRYIRYANGMEELYCHKTDPNEWNNLAENPEFAGKKAMLQAQLLEQAKLTDF